MGLTEVSWVAENSVSEVRKERSKGFNSLMFSVPRGDISFRCCESELMRDAFFFYFTGG